MKPGTTKRSLHHGMTEDCLDHSKQWMVGYDTALSGAFQQTFPWRGPPRLSAFILTEISSGTLFLISKIPNKTSAPESQKRHHLSITVLHPQSQHTA